MTKRCTDSAAYHDDSRRWDCRRCRHDDRGRAAFRRTQPGRTPGAAIHHHAAGELGLRLPEGDDVRLVHPGLALHDSGAHAAAAVARLADPHAVLVVVTAVTPAGRAAADRVLDEIVAAHGVSQLRRVLVAVVGVFGRHRISGQLRALGDRVGTRSVTVPPGGLSLAAVAGSHGPGSGHVHGTCPAAARVGVT